MHRIGFRRRLAHQVRSVRERFWPAPADGGRPAGRHSGRLGRRLGRGEADDDLPALRWQLSRRAVVASLVVALLSCAAAVAWVLAAAPRTMPAGQPVVASGGSVSAGARAPATGGQVRPGGSLKSPWPTPTGSPSSSATPGERLVVDVIGRVRRPGVYRLAPGSRVEDAITAAGGLVAGTSADSVNLARRISDGEQIAVGVPLVAGAPGVTAGADRGPGGGPGGGGQPVDLNTATAEQLDALPGVGPALAQRIIEFRDSHGRFGSVDDLKSVSGIGDAKFAVLRTRVTAG